MFEEEGNTLGNTLVAEVAGPFLFHRPDSVTTLTSGDQPADPGKVEFRERPQEGFSADEPHCSVHRAEVVDAKAYRDDSTLTPIQTLDGQSNSPANDAKRLDRFVNTW